MIYRYVAIKAASKLCGVLHRDISLGNVMLKGGKFWGGILADWDHAAKILLPEGSSYQNFRTVRILILHVLIWPLT